MSNLTKSSLVVTAAAFMAVFAGATAHGQSFNGARPGEVSSVAGWQPAVPGFNNNIGVTGFPYNPNQINPYAANGNAVPQYAPTGFIMNPAFGAVPYGVPGYIPAPIPCGGSNVSFRLGGVNAQFWRAPSGYYYPFNNFYNPLQVNTIYIAPGSLEAPVAKAPPLSVQFSDTFKFLDDVKKDQKVSDADYERLKRRATDIQNKERSLSIAQGGSLDSDYQAEIRRDLDNLSNEIISRVKK